jgi:glycosyltransferase involved in cell wall biosynthesis
MHATSSEKLDISVIIPCYNEEGSLKELYERLTKVLKTTTTKYEVIFVDDGSTDRSIEILKDLHKHDEKVKIVHFRRNFGKAMALMQGFKDCLGKTVITLDADLQDLPEEIPRLLEWLEEGFDLVSGWKRKRKDSFGRILASRIFNFFTSLFTGVKIHDFNCGLKAYRREVTDELELYGELYRFIPAFAIWKGFRVGEVIVEHGPRLYGKSKFGRDRFFRGFFDLLTIIMLTKFTQKPLHFFGALGILLLAVGSCIDGYLAALWFSGKFIGHRPLLMLGTLLIIIGIQFMFFGLLGELVVFSSPRDHDHVVKDKYGIE